MMLELLQPMRTAVLAVLLLTASAAHADEKWRDWQGLYKQPAKPGAQPQPQPQPQQVQPAYSGPQSTIATAIAAAINAAIAARVPTERSLNLIATDRDIASSTASAPPQPPEAGADTTAGAAR